MEMRKRSVKKRIFLTGFLITLVMLLTILFSNIFLGELREEALLDQMDSVVRDYEEIQTLMLMADFFGEESTCVAIRSMLSRMNEELWDLGLKIDQYRQATEEFSTAPFYEKEKARFNQRAALYYTLLKRLDDTCETDHTLMSFFYRDEDECPDCDAQAFVLTDIRLQLEDEGRSDDLALFSFDMDLDLPTIDLLRQHYNITHYPCMVIEDDTYCGLRNKDEVLELLCEHSNGTIC